MSGAMNYKSVGGVESCALYPADAVETALFSSGGCSVELSGVPIVVTLLDDTSQYEETSIFKNGASAVSHALTLVADRGCAEEWLNSEFLERAAFEGFIAVISLNDGRQLLAGYSMQLGEEHPLRLEKLISTSGTSLRQTPSITLQLVSHDADFSTEILETV